MEHGPVEDLFSIEHGDDFQRSPCQLILEGFLASTCELPSGYTEQIEEMERFMKQTWEDKERDSQRHEDVVTFFWAIYSASTFGPRSLVSIFICFVPTWENGPIWRAYFSNGLVQPPTSCCFCFAVVVFFFRWKFCDEEMARKGVKRLGWTYQRRHDTHIYAAYAY